jgi:hypothetical protein
VSCVAYFAYFLEKGCGVSVCGVGMCWLLS